MGTPKTSHSGKFLGTGFYLRVFKGILEVVG